MSQGVLIYALNNEQLDYVELALNSARLVKQHLGKEVALVTDSYDWMKHQYPNYKDFVDIVIKVVYESNISNWTPYYEFAVGDKVYYNNSIWVKKFPGPETLNLITGEEISSEDLNHNLDNYSRVYQGIDIDKWYPNLPYLAGQHVWYDDVLYRCEVGYIEDDKFSKDKYTVLLENVKDLSNANLKRIETGDIVLHERSLWQSKLTYGLEIDQIIASYNTDNLSRVYQGIDIDKWYPNLPYLAGQHVWYKNTLYRCKEDYQESNEFDNSKYVILLENVKDLIKINIFNKGDVLLFNRVLWQANTDYDDAKIYKGYIRNDLWEDTKERELVYDASPQYRRYFDGAMTHKRLKFKNDIRVKSFELSPFDKTLVIDCDYLINNSLLNYCWKQEHDFLISKEGVDLCGFRYDPRLHSLSDKSIDFYWATVFYFEKNSNTETFFNLLGHIQDNYNYYRYVYQIQHSLYRNDYAFSIAIHIMNGYQKGLWTHNLPGMLYYTIDKDVLLKHNDTTLTFLVEKEKYKGEYTFMKTKDISVHVMNKFSVSRVIRENINE